MNNVLKLKNYSPENFIRNIKMKIKDILQTIESLAPPALQESYDNSGLLTGNGENEATGALLSLDCTEEVLDEAIRNKCNLLISHHPVIFGKGLMRLNGNNYVERIVIKAIRNDISLYAVHTNLDNVGEGVNKKIAEKLGLQNTRVLSPMKKALLKLVTFAPVLHAESVRQAIFSAGAGFIGDYSDCSFNVAGTGTFKAGEGTSPFSGERGKLHMEQEIRIETILPFHRKNEVIAALLSSHPYEEVAYDIYELNNLNPNEGAGLIGDLEKEMNEKSFLQMLKTNMKTGPIRHTKMLGRPIKSVAVCGGAGSFLLDHAIASGADIFVTGDFKYHQFFDADGKILIADIGHYESEQFTPELLKDLLNKNFPTFATRLSETNTNPINYF